MGGELLACPFCGGEAKYYGQGDGVICRTCHAQVLGAGDVDDVPTWNRRASPPPPSGSAWGVKPLEWRTERGDEGFHYAASIVERYSITEYAGATNPFKLEGRDGHCSTYFPTLEAAKAAAQADYEARISTALTPSPSYAEGIEADFGGTAVQIVEAILLNLGIGTDPSREPGADRRRDRLCRLIEPMLPAPPNVKVAP